MKPTMFIADMSPPGSAWHKEFPVKPPEAYGYCYSGYVTLSAANAAIEERDKRIAELERERDDATGTLRYCERQWAEERGTMIDKFVFERARAEAAEALLKEAGPLMRDFSLIAEMEKNAPPMESVFVNVDLLRAARSIAAKIGARNE